jgi:GTP-binding protein
MTNATQIRNVAIIAHVDHGKTTLVDGLLKQSNMFRENEAVMSQALIMDSHDQERERGITILAKNTAVTWGDYTINIIDTPGHADFGGEVERTLNLADGVILVIDAQEGPMPQTKFVLKKAFELGLKPIVVVNKIDKRDARVNEVLERTYDLFLDLATDDRQLEFPVYYAVGRTGKAWAHLPADSAAPGTLTPIFQAIVDHVPAPHVEPGPFQLLVTALDWDSYQGKSAIGRIRRGTVQPGQTVVLIGEGGQVTPARIEQVLTSVGLKRVEMALASAGNIVALTGIKAAAIGDTVADPRAPEPLPRIQIEAPTLAVTVGANTSPFAGREGQFVTSRQILERIHRQLETDVALKMESASGSPFLVSGRGELHLSVFIETLRREGYELQVGKPQVITQTIDGALVEPLEALTVDVAAEFAGAVTAEVLRRRGRFLGQQTTSDGAIRLDFELTTRGLLGLRSQLLSLTRGTAVVNSLFQSYVPLGPAIPRVRTGALIASEAGTAVAYGLDSAQGRGLTFIPPGTAVYEGMIIGQSGRGDDLEINVTKEKKQTNMRSAGGEQAIILTPFTTLSLEQCLDFLEDDELLEVTPESLRLRKKLLSQTDRAKARRSPSSIH